MKTLFTDNPAYRRLRVVSVTVETEDVKTFTLTPADGQPFPYKAGQFLTLVFQGRSGEERRSYSFSSSPDADEALSVTIKRVPNGRFSRPLFDHALPGDIWVTTPAAGQFTLPESMDDHRQVIFFAAGIGITPILSMLKATLRNHPALKLLLIYSNTDPLQTVFQKELTSLATESGDRFRIEFLFSSARMLDKARLSKWLLPQLLAKRQDVPKPQQLCYICGPFAYMRMVIYGLEELGYTAASIKKENFDTTLAITTNLPPDRERHNVEINIGNNKHEVPVQYPDSILKAAKKNGILLPYSCETGKCGACTAICGSGQIWMSYNEVLTPADLAEGKILTCTGYPINGDASIHF